MQLRSLIASRRFVAVAAIATTAAVAATPGGSAAIAAAQAAAATVPVKVNFQPAAAAVPTGYIADSGAPYSDAAGSGWVTQASLSSATHAPLDIRPNTRDRNSNPDQRYDTMIHMQYAAAGTGVSTPAAWEYSLPNGTYTVSIAVGDAGDYFDSTHRINVEGTTLVAGFVPTAAAHFADATGTITVADGKLTVDAIGGTNTKLDFIEIAPATTDTTPPAAPANVAASGGDGRVTLTWTANSESDLAGYNVYRSTTLPVNTGAAPLNGTTKLPNPGYVDQTVTNGTTYHYAVEAVDSSGNNAVAAAVSATPSASGSGGVDVKVNFSDATTVPPAGYVRDYGQAYGPRTDANQGTGLTYGWVAPGSSTPRDLVGKGRNRGTPSDVRLATLMHMQYTDAGGVSTPGSWELAVPAGNYTVTVSAGDASFVDSVHQIRAEGQAVLAAFVPSAATPFKAATATVSVTDGRLTIDSEGGTNTKIDYVTVSSSTSPPPPPPPTDAISVNFQSETASVPAGHVRDFGEPYGARTGASQGTGLSYGWVSQGGSTPLSLVGNGRDRNVNSDQRYDTFLHMQYTGSSGVTSPGSWEIAVPDGRYEVTAAVGDPDTVYDSSHAIALEGAPLITNFAPTTLRRFQVATSQVAVSDGRLTVSAAGGANTKIDFITITPFGTDRPSVSATTPATGATNVFRDAAISAEVTLPNVGHGVDASTLTAQTVRLVRTSDNAEMAANLNTSGGGDVIVLQPKQALDADTTYRFEVTAGAKDLSGAAFLPYTTTFTTGQATSSSGVPTGVAFDQVQLANAAGVSFTSLAFGPDGKLYAGTLDGYIYRFSVNADGTLAAPQIISSLRTANGGARMLIGIAFDPASTAGNPIVWVSHGVYAFNDAPDWTGKLTRMSGSDLGTVTDYVVGLPRSIRDHMTNSVAFGPDGALYLVQGSNTAMGAPDSAWGDRPERLLNAALLRVNLQAITSPPLNVQTEAGGSYNPFAAGVPVTIYASGIRNAFDLVWHSNGRLYVPTNGSAAGGNTPSTPASLPASCQSRIDSTTSGAYTGPAIPGLTNVTFTENDWIFRVVQGGYYGHPNPARCEWAMNGGNPTTATDPAEIPQYPVGTKPDRNYRGYSWDLGAHYSPDGALEYKSGAFGGALRGKVLVTRYSGGDDIVALTPGGANLDITAETVGIPGFGGFVDPLDVVEQPSGNGNLYVSELGANKITLLRPATSTSGNGRLALQNLDGAPFDDRLVFNRIGSLTSPPAQGVHDRATLRLKNTAADPVRVTGLPIAGPWQVVSPATLPVTVAGGGQLDVVVKFVATSGRVTNGTLTIQSDDPSAPTRIVQLSGYWQSVSENDQEPTSAEVVSVFGYKTVVTAPGQSLNQAGFVRAVGDEVLSPYWVRSNTTQPVVVRQLASLHSCFNTATLLWFNRGSTTNNTATVSSGNDCQSLLPHANGSTTAAATASFSPTAAFGFKIDFSESSDPTQNNQTPDRTGGCPGPCGHHVRFWVAKDRAGNVIPNTYLMMMDYSGINYDYNDNIYLVTNVAPAPVPQVYYRLNAGATSNYTDTNGALWVPDSAYFTPTNAAAEGATYANQAIAYTNDDTIFDTYRAYLGNIPMSSRILSYNLPLPAGVTRVTVRLLFAERFWTGAGQRVFNIDAEGARVSTNLDLFKVANGKDAALTTALYHVNVADGALTLKFSASVDYAAINGIEVLADP
jgi:hypothetical protein